jgi:hypothetical protein
MSYSDKEDVKDNKCEICGLQATAGIIQDDVKIRYTCQDHYLKLYERIANNDRKE